MSEYQYIRDLNEDQMIGLMESLGEKAFRGRQIFKWVHEKCVASFDDMKNIPAALRKSLTDKYIVDPLKILKKQVSNDKSTAKYLFELPDGATIESVWMRYRHGDSICVSSQVGCRMGCSFCASTIDGLNRNLQPAEILSQIYDIEKDMYPDGDGHIGSIIVMGMGEPFDNYDNLIRFIRLITDENGRNLSARHVTVSTCGLPEGIKRLSDEGLPITLALSLHAPDDKIRNMIMPISKKYPMDEVFDACRDYFSKTGRRITFEYSMIRGVNDSSDAANKLVKTCKNLIKQGMPVHINLIPLNSVTEREYKRSDEESIRQFKIILEKNQINVTIRREMGSEIDAACGQLRRAHEKEKPIKE